MRCSKCGQVGESKFCPTCGVKMVEEKKDPEFMFICDGTDEDGNPCNAQIVSITKFCHNCGKKLDPSVFKVACKRCETELQVNNKFCPECGLPRNAEPSTCGTPELEISGEEGDGKGTVPHAEQKPTSECNTCPAEDDANISFTSPLSEMGESGYDMNPPVDEYNKLSVQQTHTFKGGGTPEHGNPIDGEEDSGNGSVSHAQAEESVNDSLVTPQLLHAKPIPTLECYKGPAKEEAIGSTVTLQSERGENSGDMNLLVDGCCASSALQTRTFREGETGESSSEKNPPVDGNSKISVQHTQSFEERGTPELENQVDGEASDDYANPKPTSECDGDSVEEETNGSCTNAQSEMGDEHSQEFDKSIHAGENRLENAESNKRKGKTNNDMYTNDNKKKLTESEAEIKRNEDSYPDTHSSLRSISEEVEQIPNNSESQNAYNVQESQPSEDGESSEDDDMPYMDDDEDISSEANACANLGRRFDSTVENQATEIKRDEDTTTTTGQNKGQVKKKKGNGQDDKSGKVNKVQTKKKQGGRGRKKISPGKSSSETDVDTGKSTGQKEKTEHGQSSHSAATKKNVDRASRSQVAKDPSSKGSSGNHTTIRFRAILSREFQFDDKCQLILRIGDNWDNRSRICKTKRCENKHEYEVEYGLLLPKSRLRGQPLEYKYCVVNAKKEAVWESFVVGHNKNANRSIILQEDWQRMDIVDQYDGVIEKLSTIDSWITILSGIWVPSWSQQYARYAESSVQRFCRSILQSEEINPYFQLKRLLMCYRHIYNSRIWYWGTETDFLNAVGRIVWKELLDACNTDRGGKQKHERKILQALSTVLLGFENLLPATTVQEWQIVCRDLLMKSDKTTKMCFELELMNKYFPNRRDEICYAMTSLARVIAEKTTSPLWMFFVPWIHFLCEESEPYQIPPLDCQHDKHDGSWWGISQFGDSLKMFKRQTAGCTSHLDETLKLLEPMFELDYLLPRTFVAALNTSQVKEVIQKGIIAEEITLASLYHHTKIVLDEVINRKYWGKEKEVIVECLHVGLETLRAGSGSRNYRVSQDKMSIFIAQQLVAESIRGDCAEITTLSAKILLQCLSGFYERINKDHRNDDDIQMFLNACLSQLKSWIETFFKDWTNKRVMEQLLLVFNDWYADSGTIQETLIDEWNKRISGFLEDLLQNEVFSGGKRVMQIYVELYCQRNDMFKSPMQKVLSKLAFQAIGKGYELNYNSLSDREVRKFGDLLSNLFLEECEKLKQKTMSDEQIQHFLEWPAFTQFVEIYAQKDTTNRRVLSDECLKKLQSITKLFRDFTHRLLNGEITVKVLNLIQARQEIFAEIAALVGEDRQWNKELILKAVQVRCSEVQALKRHSELMTTFTSLCTHLNINTKKIRNALRQLADMDKKRVKDFCKPVAVTMEVDLGEINPQLTVLDVSRQVYNILPEVEKCSKSNVFMKIWNQECQENRKTCCTIDDVISQVWNPAKEKLVSTRRSIESGDITFSEFDELLSKPSKKEDYIRVENNLRQMEISDEGIRFCLKQIQKCRQLDQCTESARAIHNLAETYKLQGDFNKIKEITEFEDIDKPINCFDESLLRECEFLSKIDENRINCLDAFCTCVPLVEWIRESMKESGLKELKVFVDLAFMSAGDEPINIARVQCLHSAVTGYAPLIFKLDQTAGYRELNELCTDVWKELQVDPQLPEKLRDTNRHLDWFQNIQQAHGSVEVTSLMQAEAINDSGTYTLGKTVWKKGGQDQRADESVLKVEDVLTLRVQEKGETIQKGTYTFSQLQDLQSRLMLVAGQADNTTDSVDTFTSVFDSLTRLSNVYIRLWSSGCLLFKDFSATFRCSVDQPVCIRLDFGEEKSSPYLEGTRTEKENLKEIIPEVARFMEKCLEDWLLHFQEKRKQFLYLNFFTISQLVILQQELVKIGKRDPSYFLYPLLSAVKENCKPDDLTTAMIEAKGEIEGAKEEIERKEIVPQGPEKPEFDENNAEKEKFIKQMKQAGFSDELAENALRFVCSSDVAGGLNWCLEHDESPDDETLEDNEVVTDSEETTVSQTPFVVWSETATDLQSLVRCKLAGYQHESVGAKPLIEVLCSLWEMFLDSLSSNIRDYLSLDHLGIILRHLASKDAEKVIHRRLPVGLKEGEPNLIVCSSVEVLPTTLTIYIEQPLPKSDEVLLCCSDTTQDEVDIFLRRALFDDTKKIHCLVNADMLDYDVSEAAEKLLKAYRLELKKGTPYRLVVICATEHEYKSGIVSSLDKFKRPSLPVKVTHLKRYLADLLTVRRSSNDVKPAALVDQDSCSVRVAKSWRAGVGKSLYKERQAEQVENLNKQSVIRETVSIPLQEKKIDFHYLIGKLLKHTTPPDKLAARLFHIDIYHEVQNGVDDLLFNLLILGCLVDKTGYVWRKSTLDLYLIETIPLMTKTSDCGEERMQYFHTMLEILPDMTCRSPLESLHIYHGNKPIDFTELDQLFDDKQFRCPVFQRPFQYLLRLDEGKPLKSVDPTAPEGLKKTCLQTLLKHCGLENPSWSELHSFVWFLNTQLVDYESNAFVGEYAQEDLPGFAKFVLLFLIQMSRDFSTRSLNISEESSDQDSEKTVSKLQSIETYKMRRTWESSPHPYLFFNKDGCTFTFLGFNIERSSGNLIDLQTGQILQKAIMTKNLFDGLVRNQVNLSEDFDALPRTEKIRKLCNVMGVDYKESIPDPDDTYELTTDNVKKIMAIYMRFRCDIPVIIMGETGCGKTRLVKFLCDLTKANAEDTTNMILMKVHGGTTHRDIINKVREAEEIAKENEQHRQNMFTVLFFDEANTTEAIGLIKEIMCDKSVKGEKLKLCENLKMVAACNPYRKHSDELIKKLEQAGLGYHVNADETSDRFGRVPMRQLVYRVQPLPQSLLPLVWDFGQLSTKVEDLYIRQMVRRFIGEGKIPHMNGLKEVISAILTASQEFMRSQKDECSFVSLRDVDRVLTVMSWFYQQSVDKRTLFDLMDAKLGLSVEDPAGSDSDGDDEMEPVVRERDTTRSLILALGVCYHACLKKRSEYRDHIKNFFKSPCLLQRGADQIKEEIECCQDVFLDNVHLEKNIAKNMALKENLFMMVVCVELRIPLFLVGKPGSSKSLAKTVVADSLQGSAAREEFFRQLKQVQMVSFQCSPLSTPDGIVGTFRQCAQFQKDKDLDRYVSVVVLDEVGLAEDSPRMPLKTLHPLLEDGCQGNEKPEKYKKVAFIGISNWALDPAKMNRGILVQREVPDLEELENSARGICNTDKEVATLMASLIEPMAKSYLEIFKQATRDRREFYGLRDFYSLVKMVYSFVEKTTRPPTWNEMQHAIRRNFGGLDVVAPEENFRENLCDVIQVDTQSEHGQFDNSPAGLIEACLFGPKSSESRYLLLLTENYGALTVIQQKILTSSGEIKPITIFGSSFRSDQEYTQVCRNINKIKVCMETGNTVLLLNLENLYESLYDALNQYYVYFGGERYVDLGLGTHRVKCPVHKNFRLIVIAEKQTVYKKFPIPLINRLEKHFLTINTMLTADQQNVVQVLLQWLSHFVSNSSARHLQRGESLTKVGDVFIGYHDDTCPAVVIDVWENHELEHKKKSDEDMPCRLNGSCFEKLVSEAKYELLLCATPESLIRLKNTTLSFEEQLDMRRSYFEIQTHDSLLQFLHEQIVVQQKELRTQVTTHSKLMANSHKDDIGEKTDLLVENMLLIETLSSFETEQQFTNKIRDHIQRTENKPSLMLIQCDSGDVNSNLVACARYCVRDEIQRIKKKERANLHVVFVVQLPRGAHFTGFQCGVWQSVHIDDLYPEDANMPTLHDMRGKSIADIFREAIQLPEGEQIETEQDQMKKTKRISVRGLVLRCVQSALSMVKNKDGNTPREMKRVSLVRILLHKDQNYGNNSFLHGVCRLLHKLLYEKETHVQGTVKAQNWMIEEAASQDSISKSGTFRRSCLQTLESKLSPILAVIIAYLDTNGNLSILEEQDLPWKQELWLSILNTTESQNLQFSDLQSPTGQKQLKEVEVKSTGCGETFFSAKVPFSWLLINKVNEIIKKHQSSEDTYNREVNVLRQLPLGVALSKITDEETVSKVVTDYAEDLVHTVYNASVEKEHELVVLFLLGRSRAGSDEDLRGTDLIKRIVKLHLTHKKFATSLDYFWTINSIWPECSSKIAEKKERSPKLFEDEDITFTALNLLLDELSPTIPVFNRSEGRAVWLEKVHKCRPVVEKIISLYSDVLHGGIEIQIQEKDYQHARIRWSHVVVVKLCLEHLFPVASSDKIITTSIITLWQSLQEQDEDLKRSLTVLEKFLEKYNLKAMEKHGFAGKCAYCKTTLDGPPFALPCNHVVCDKCADVLTANRNAFCPVCKKDFPNDWELTRQTVKKKAFEEMKASQKRCNTLFMEVVSQISFAENTAPSTEVVRKLLQYVFLTTKGDQQRTREFTIFKTGKGLDPNPVFRSFLLQLLSRTSENDLKSNLELYLTQAKNIIKDAPEETHQYVELCVLIIQCLEDMLAIEANKRHTDDIQFATEALEKARSDIITEENESDVETLYGIAKARMGLCVLAKSLSDIAGNMQTAIIAEEETELPVEVINLASESQLLFEESKILSLRSYLVKVICRSFGIQVYQTICQRRIPELEWINFLEVGKVVEVPDRYFICGRIYTEIREALTKTLLEGDAKTLEETMEDTFGSSGHIEAMLKLAVHREVTCANLYPAEKLSRKSVQIVQKFITDVYDVKDKDFFQALLQNKLSPKHLLVQQGTAVRSQGMQCIVVHFMVVMAHASDEKSLLTPLRMLIKDPRSCQGMYLPAMPQDDLEEIKAMFKCEQTVSHRFLIHQYNLGTDKVVFYRCPNGHAYALGECGNPYHTGKCNECGAEIGGKRYVLAEGNTKDSETAPRKQTGHILGKAKCRDQNPKAERTMTPANCRLIRLLVHLAMYSATGVYAQDIVSIISPEIEVVQVEDFLWAHIQRDIDDVHQELGFSEDDVLLLMHSLLDSLLSGPQTGEQITDEVLRWSTKEGRQVWEEQFSATYLQDLLQDLQNTLASKNQILARDERLGGDQLQCMLWEVEDKDENETVDKLQHCPSFWRFRTQISLAHLRLEVLALPQDKYTILKLFLQEEHFLRCLRYIPSILRLHRILFQKYQRKLDKSEASQITVARLKAEIGSTELHQLIEDFTEAWELVRQTLKCHRCITDFGVMLVPADLCDKSIDEDTPISVFLPTTKETGLCSFALLDFLFRKQNDMLEKYMAETKRSSVSSVKPKDITLAHLISYDPQHDLKPILLANCQYSFEMGKGKKIKYDFAGLERQLMDRFLFSKSQISIERMIEIDLMVYRTELTNSDVFKKLNEKISQDPLSAHVKIQITNESRLLPDLCQSLSYLDITLSFLTSTGGQRDRNLHEFMSKVLQMETTIHSLKAQQICELRHTRSLWLLFSLQKSKLMTESKQQSESIFETIAAEFHEDLSDTAKDSIRAYTQRLSADRLAQLLEVFHEYILLRVSERQQQDEDYMDTRDNVLKEWMYGLMEDESVLDILNDFPPDILYRHSVRAWMYCYDLLKEKQNGNSPN